MSNTTSESITVIERSPIEETMAAEAAAAMEKAPKKDAKKDTKKDTIAKEDFAAKLKSIITIEGYQIERISDSGATIRHGDKTLSVRYRPYGYRINLKCKPNGRTLQAVKKAKCVENTGKVAKTYPWSVYVKAADAMAIIAQNI